MSRTLVAVQKLILQGEIKVSSHGYDELSENDIFLRDILSTAYKAQVVEDYPDFGKGQR